MTMRDKVLHLVKNSNQSGQTIAVAIISSAYHSITSISYLGAPVLSIISIAECFFVFAGTPPLSQQTYYAA